VVGGAAEEAAEVGVEVEAADGAGVAGEGEVGPEGGVGRHGGGGGGARLAQAPHLDGAGRRAGHDPRLVELDAGDGLLVAVERFDGALAPQPVALHLQHLVAN